MKLCSVLLSEVGRGVSEAVVSRKLENGYMSNNFNPVLAYVVTFRGIWFRMAYLLP